MLVGPINPDLSRRGKLDYTEDILLNLSAGQAEPELMIALLTLVRLPVHSSAKWI
jgi:hypothetical protein